VTYIPKFRKSVPDIGIQMALMRKFFPVLVYKKKNGRRLWEGTLQPTVSSPNYTIRIFYRGRKSPKVFILNPMIEKTRPHHYPDGSLCLHYPKDWNWTSDKMIAKTIVPWVIEWLLWYEYWLETGIWWGEEAPHNGKKQYN